jgi:hypothetical protein
VLLIIEGGAVPIPLGEPARPVLAHRSAHTRRLPPQLAAAALPGGRFGSALRLSRNYIGTEHILLALRELEDGAGVLSGLGIGKAAVHAHVASALAAIRAAQQGQ